MKFKRQDYFKLKRLGTKWRRPKGRQSKLRVKKSGSGMKVSIGYGSPKKEKPKTVRKVSDMEKLEKDSLIIIQAGVGLKKLDQIVEKAKKMGVKISNKRRIEKLVRKKAELEKKKQEKVKKKEKKAEKKPAEKKEEKPKPAEKKESDKK